MLILGVWEKVKQNVGKAHQGTEKISIEFWATGALVPVVTTVRYRENESRSEENRTASLQQGEPDHKIIK